MEECRSAMLHDNMDLSRLIVHVHHVEDNRKNRVVCDARSPKPLDQVSLAMEAIEIILASTSSPG